MDHLPTILAFNRVWPDVCRRHYRSSFALWHSLCFFTVRTLASGASPDAQCRRLQQRQEADWLAWQHEQLSLCQTLAAVLPAAAPAMPRVYQHLADGLLLYARRRCAP